MSSEDDQGPPPEDEVVALAQFIFSVAAVYLLLKALIQTWRIVVTVLLG